MAIENANSHPYKVAITKESGEMYANSHPYQVVIVGGGGGQEGRVVDELPEVGEPGYIYLVLKEESSEGNIYDEYMWVLQRDGETYGWEHIATTDEVRVPTVVQTTGTSTEDVMSQKAVTDALVSASPTVVQTTGTSTTDVMSQKAVTDAIYAMEGLARELTSADYDYPSDNPDGVAIWKLEPGIYYAPDNVKTYTSTVDGFVNGGNTYFVGATTSGLVQIIQYFSTTAKLHYYYTNATTGVRDSTGIMNPSVPSVVQATGASTTNVMSQKAVTGMVFAGTDTRKVQISGSAIGNRTIAIGYDSYAAGEENIAIGRSSATSASSSYSVAIGAYAYATQKGQFDISAIASPTGYNWGYNDSRYRLLTGLYDPQSDHDAATKGYVDTAVASAETEEFTTAEWNSLWT